MADRFQPTLSPVSTQPFISSGVKDTGLAQAITSVGELGVAAYTGYQTAEEARGYEEDINQYLKSQIGEDTKGLERKSAFDLEMANKVKTENEFWNAAGDVKRTGTLVEAGDIDEVQKGMSLSLDKLIQAQKQGRMTIPQLEARIMDTTRRAVARNPFLQDELIKAGQRYMDLSGASAYMKSQLSIEKSKQDLADEQTKQLVAWSSKFGIPMSRPNWREESAQAAMLEGEHARKKAFMEESLQKRTLKQAELADLVNDPANRQKWMQGELLNFRSTYNRLNNMAQFSTSDKVIAMSTEIDKSINLLESAAAQMPAGSTGAITGQIALMNKQRDMYKDALEGGPNSRAAKSGLEFLEATAKLPYVNDSVQLEMVNKRLSAMRTLQGSTGEISFNQTEGAALMQYLKMDLPPGQHSPLANVKLNTPDGKQQVATAFAMLDPEQVEKAVDINSSTISTAIKHIKATPDGNQSAQLMDVLMDQVLAQSKATGKPIANLVNDSALSEMNKYITELMGNARSDGGSVDYNPQTNTFSYLDKEGKVNQAGSDRANKLMKTLIGVNGFKDEDTIDKWGAFFAGKGAMPAPSPTKTWEARTPDEAFNLLKAGTIDESTYMAIIKDMKGGTSQPSQPPAPQQESAAEKARVDKMKAKLGMGEFAATPDTQAKPATLQDLATKPAKVDTRPSLQEEAYNKGIKAVKEFKPSPMMKRNPTDDSIQSSGVDEVVMEGLTKVHPALGMATGAALIAFGGVQNVPSLVKYMPKLLSKAGKVAATGSNVTVAGANSGAQAAIVNSMLNTAAKANKAKMETLYQEFWKTQYKLGTPKTDLQWSNAIAEANLWVAEKINPSVLKTMKGK